MGPDTICGKSPCERGRIQRILFHCRS
jgi:hypothetical protein